MSPTRGDVFAADAPDGRVLYLQYVGDYWHGGEVVRVLPPQRQPLEVLAVERLATGPSGFLCFCYLADAADNGEVRLVGQADVPDRYATVSFVRVNGLPSAGNPRGWWVTEAPATGPGRRCWTASEFAAQFPDLDQKGFPFTDVLTVNGLVHQVTQGWTPEQGHFYRLEGLFDGGRVNADALHALVEKLRPVQQTPPGTAGPGPPSPPGPPAGEPYALPVDRTHDAEWPWYAQDYSLCRALDLPDNGAAEHVVRQRVQRESPDLAARLLWDSEAGAFYVCARDETDIHALAEIVSRLVNQGPHPDAQAGSQITDSPFFRGS